MSKSVTRRRKPTKAQIAAASAIKHAKPFIRRTRNHLEPGLGCTEGDRVKVVETQLSIHLGGKPLLRGMSRGLVTIGLTAAEELMHELDHARNLRRVVEIGRGE